MVLNALRGGLGFLSRLPVGHDERAWNAFRTTPVALPLAGYVIGALVALPFLAPVPAPTTALLYLLALVAVAGINHFDGVADLGDAAAVHGSAERRRAVMKDTDTGVGALLAVSLVIAGLALAGLALADRPLLPAVGIVVAAEVGAKLGMAAVACFGTATHEGLGSQLAEPAAPRSFVPPAVVSLPVAAFGSPAAAALLGAVGCALVVFHWCRRRLGGASGDVFGAANELARVVGLHAGVVVWTLS